MQLETPHLFLYGTLRPLAKGRLGRARRERLAQASVSLGPASIAGRLYDLGLYPGAVASSDAAERVIGEAVTLSGAGAVFSWLDPYEGIMASGINRFDFERTRVPVVLATGDFIEAWVYLFRGEPPSESRVLSGCWDDQRQVRSAE